ncbi:MAG: DUF1576 domain-containing protein [Clostridia bacterium]
MLDFEKHLYRLMLVTIVLFAATGLLRDGLTQTMQGFLLLQQHPSRLINDFTVVGGIGGALLNAAVMGLLSLGIIRYNRVRLAGPTMAAVFTIMGFSLFGKTVLNVIPIMIGVMLAGKLVGKPFRNYIIIALFGTALGPLVTFMVFEAGFTGVPAVIMGTAAGIAAGMALPALAMAMLRLHEGFNLYNIGLTSGFFGLFAAAVLAAAKQDVSIKIIWNDTPSLELMLLIPVIALLFVVWGVAMDGRNLGKNLLAIMKLSGRLPSDFMDNVSPGSALVNTGLLGLAGSAYLFIIGADFNGPTIGGLLTVMGFASFGKHPRNCWPVAAGVIIATLVFGKSLTDPGPVLALLFGTTLAPLAGEFGPWIGMAAGFVHLVMVERTAAWHGGLDLYNNGFAGGLTATFFVAVIEWRRSNKQD